jgi:hypothetical protein
VLDPRSLRRALQVDFEAAIADTNRVTGYGVPFVSRFAYARLPVEFVVVPWTNDVVAIEAPFTQGTGGMVAHAVDDAEFSVTTRHGEAKPSDFYGGDVTRSERFGRAEVVPIGVGHAES